MRILLIRTGVCVIKGLRGNTVKQVRMGGILYYLSWSQLTNIILRLLSGQSVILFTGEPVGPSSQVASEVREEGWRKECYTVPTNTVGSD